MNIFKSMGIYEFLLKKISRFSHLSSLGSFRVAGLCRIPTSTRIFYCTPSSVPTWFKPHHLRSFSMVSFHLYLGFPLFLLPSIFNSYIFRLSSSFPLLQTWPNHSNLLFLISSKIGITLAFRLISSFL